MGSIISASGAVARGVPIITSLLRNTSLFNRADVLASILGNFFLVGERRTSSFAFRPHRGNCINVDALSTCFLLYGIRPLMAFVVDIIGTGGGAANRGAISLASLKGSFITRTTTGRILSSVSVGGVAGRCSGVISSDRGAGTTGSLLSTISRLLSALLSGACVSNFAISRTSKVLSDTMAFLIGRFNISATGSVLSLIVRCIGAVGTRGITASSNSIGARGICYGRGLSGLMARACILIRAVVSRGLGVGNSAGGLMGDTVGNVVSPDTVTIHSSSVGGGVVGRRA